jgi:hypothetical protein
MLRLVLRRFLKSSSSPESHQLGEMRWKMVSASAPHIWFPVTLEYLGFLL